MSWDDDVRGKPLSCCREWRALCFKHLHNELTETPEPVATDEKKDDDNNS